MSLFKCPECGQQISDKADKCPYCGLPSSYFNIAKANSKDENVFYGCTNYFNDTGKCTNMVSLPSEPV